MSTYKNTIFLSAAAFLAVGVVVNCTGTMAGPGEQWSGPTQEVGPACDPDGYAPCPEDLFVCWEDDAGNKHCEGQNPAVPDGGTWDCYEEGTTLVCIGDHLPDGGDWDCQDLGDSVVCRTHAYVPAGGAEDDWNCWYEGEFRVCESGDGTTQDDDGPGDDGPGDDGDSNPWDDWFPDEDGNGIPDEFEDFGWDDLNDLFDLFGGGDNPNDDTPDDDGPGEGDDCLCVAGAWRYCDTPTYCRWGVQHCNPSGMSWGACIETSLPAACAPIDGWYSPDAEACCIEQGFCCQDMWDLDMDGDTWESLGDCTDILCE